MARKKQKSEDELLIELVNKGDSDAFETLIKKYEVKVFHLAMRFTRNEEDAEEVLQDVFTTLHRKLKLFEGKSAFSSWLYRIVVNAAFMKLRKRRQKPTLHLEDLAPLTRQQVMESEFQSYDHVDQYAQDNEIRDILESVIEKLPDQYRAVFILRDVNGYSNQEASEILELSIPAIKSRLHRSRLMLRKKLYRYYEELTGNTYVPEEDEREVQAAA
jgi:RNA polymerase sigma-70 factor (ECF subfamily)